MVEIEVLEVVTEVIVAAVRFGFGVNTNVYVFFQYNLRWHREKNHFFGLVIPT